MIIVGAGGYGCEVATLLTDLGRSFVGAVDDAEPDVDRLRSVGLVVLGPVSEAPRFAAEFIVAVGYARPRRELAVGLEAFGLRPASPVIHDRSVLLGATELGRGSVVMPNVTISRGTSCGPHTLVNYNASIGHDCTLGYSVTVGPNAAVGGECSIGDGVMIGSGAIILQGLEIGADATIGSGAVVTRPVAPGATVVGVPAKAINTPLPPPGTTVGFNS